MPRLARLDAPGILHHVMGLVIFGYTEVQSKWGHYVAFDPC